MLLERMMDLIIIIIIIIAMCIKWIRIMYNVGFKLHVIMNVKGQANRGAERKFDT